MILEEVCPAGLRRPPIVSIDTIISRVARKSADVNRETLSATDLPAGVPVVRVPAPNDNQPAPIQPIASLRRHV